MAPPKKNDTAKTGKGSKPSTSPTGGGLLGDLDAIIGEMGVKEGRIYKPVPSGINVLDYYNGRYFADHANPGEYELFTGLPQGKLIMIIGYTGSGKTTFSVQAGMNLVQPYADGSVFHFDLENAYSKERVADITGLPMDIVNKKYRRFDPVPLETIYAFVKKVRDAKLKRMANDESVWVTDETTGERVPVPTVIIIDTVAALQSNDVMNENSEMGSLMFESGAQAKANNAFAQRLAGMIGEPNITIIAVNHIRDAIQQGPVRKAKRVQYLGADETVPGGHGFPQYSDYYLKMVPSDSLTNKADEGFAIYGKIVKCTIIKSRLSYDGRQFDLILSDRGIDNTWTNLHFLKSVKQLKGAGAHMFIEAPDGRTTCKFAQRGFAELYEGDAEFREIADARISEELLNIIPQPGTAIEQELIETALALDNDIPIEE